jgi:hypothetical protein
MVVELGTGHSEIGPVEEITPDNLRTVTSAEPVRDARGTVHPFESVTETNVYVVFTVGLTEKGVPET